MSARVWPTVTVVTESYNLEAGQSLDALRRSIQSAVDAVTHLGGGPHEVLIVDCSDGEHTADVVAKIAVEAPHRLRHLMVPEGTGYDTIKDVAAIMAGGEVVVYIDGDCRPLATPSAWLATMIATLLDCGAPGVGGLTVYEGTSPYSLASSALDFGFVLDDPQGRLDCYASNNSCFWRSARSAEPMERSGIRCSCYLHAQDLKRRGTPMVRASGPEAAVEHERTALLDERLRRGYDAVMVARLSPDTPEARYFTGGRLRDSTLGVLRFLAFNWRSDAKRCRRVCQAREVGTARLVAALLMIRLLRALEVGGVWRAIWRPGDPRWQQKVTLEDALRTALRSETSDGGRGPNSKSSMVTER